MKINVQQKTHEVVDIVVNMSIKHEIKILTRADDILKLTIICRERRKVINIWQIIYKKKKNNLKNYCGK